MQHHIANLHLSTHMAKPNDNNHATKFQWDLQPRIQETQRTTHTGTTSRCKTQRRNRSCSERPQPQPPHTGVTFHRRLQPLHTEKQGFVLRLPPQHKSYVPYATFMQSLQCMLQHHVANLHLSTHMAKPDDNNHATKFQCDLQPRIQETQRTTHTGTTTRCKTQRRNRVCSERPRPQPPHTGVTFHRRLQPLYTEKQGFVLRLPPQHKPYATFMQSLQCML